MLVITIIIFVFLLCWRFQGVGSNTFGSAAWISIWEANKARLFKSKGLRVGDWLGAKGLGVHYESTHAITFGSSGSWKGISAILPNLLTLPYVFLIDPGGENTAIASKQWTKKGYTFRCINFFEMFDEKPWALPAHGFNPLDFLDANSPSFAADALLFAEMLTPRTGNEGGSNAYFKNASESVKRAMLVHIKTSETPKHQNIATLYEYVNSDAAGWERLLENMKASTVCGGLVAQEAIKLDRIESQAGTEFSAIMSTIQQDLGFLADPLIRDKLKQSDVDFSILKGQKFGQKGGVISVILPLEYIESHAAITRLALACAVLEMQRTPHAKNKVVFLLDEAAALGKLLRFPNWLATLRKYRVTFWSIWQNVGQVVHLYDKNWQTIVSNCGLRQFLSVGDLETAEYAEKLLGRTTVTSASTNPKGEASYSETSRSLALADELFRMATNRQFVFIDNLRPILLAKTPYWKRSDLVGRFHPNPYHSGKTPGLDFFLGLSVLKTTLVRWGLFWMAPHPIAACIILLHIGLFAAAVFGSGQS